MEKKENFSLIPWLDFVPKQESLRRWEQFVLDHQNYDDTYQNCTGWQKDIRNRLINCTITEGDKFSLQTKLARIQVSYFSSVM